jgi:hypothetical protein
MRGSKVEGSPKRVSQYGMAKDGKQQSASRQLDQTRIATHP